MFMTCAWSWSILCGYPARDYRPANMAEQLQSDARKLVGELFKHRDEVCARVPRGGRRADREQLHDAFVQAILQIGGKPEQFDPERGNIVDFLVGATRRTLRDIVRAATALRRGGGKKPEPLVAPEDPNARRVLDVVMDSELAELARAEAARTPEERQFIELWANGEDRVAEISRVMGWQSLSAD